MQNDSPKFQRNLSKTDETSFTMRGRSETVPRPFRDHSEHDPSMKPSVRNPPRNRGYQCLVHFQTRMETKLNQIGRCVFSHVDVEVFISGPFNSCDARVGVERLYRRKVPKTMSGPQH